MRLWHEALISQLPRPQLLGQHRECCALRGNGWGGKQARVGYVFTPSPHRAERPERPAAGSTFHRLGRGEHLRRSGGLIVNAIAGFRRTDETPKILVVKFCGGAHELDRAVVSGVADVETIGRDLQRVPASAGGKLSALDRRGLKRRCEHIGREGSGSAQPESQRKK